MKPYIILTIIFLIISCDKSKEKSSDILTDNEFKEYIFQFNPNHRESVSEEDYNFGKSSFEITTKKIRDNSFSIGANDYWSLFLAQVSLREPIEYTRHSFYKAYELKPEIICLLLQVQENEVKDGYQKIISVIPEIQKIVDTCQAVELSVKDDFSLKSYSNDNKLNYNLVSLFEKINLSDQRYRQDIDTYRDNRIKQNIIDDENQKTIDSLFNIHKVYIGKSFVGNKYDHVMWLVIQHSNLENIKKYFPVMNKAYKNGELSEDAFKSLIDRMYNLDHGYQIFGSQAGVKIAPDSIRKKVLNKISF